MENMKMSDVFGFNCKSVVAEFFGQHLIVNEVDTARFKSRKHTSAVAHAINSHDRLVEENSDLRVGLKLMIEQFKSEHNCEYEYKIIKWNEDLLNK